jgi:hypothetical protein
VPSTVPAAVSPLFGVSGDSSALAGLAEVAEHDVGRLEVAVDHAAGVGELDGEADVGEAGQERAQREAGAQSLVGGGVAGEDLGQGHAGDPLHDEERPAGVVDAEIVDGHDRRVIEETLDPRLADEARDRLGGRALLRRQRLDRDLAADPGVEGDADLAHAALADQIARLVAPALGDRAQDGQHRLGRRGDADRDVAALPGIEDRAGDVGVLRELAHGDDRTRTRR